jgi:hypothetical protein
MSLFSAAFLSRRAQDLRAGLRHAFAVQPEQESFTTEDLALLERLADAIVTRGMAAPAALFLESIGPMNFLGSQAVHILTPIIESALSGTEVTRIARLLERRDSIPRLMTLIEARATPSQGAPAQ